MGFLRRFDAQVHALLRIIVGFLFACHGASKVLGLLGGPPPGMSPGLLWSSGPIELVGGVLVLLGLFGAVAAFVCSGEMAVAYFVHHQPQALFPMQNGGELAIVYCWVFLLIAVRGSGIWSVDAARGAGGLAAGEGAGYFAVSESIELRMRD
jgi:putative oxidoreductase